MNQNEIIKLSKQVHQLLAQSKLNDAIDALQALIEECNQWELTEKYQQTKMSYQLMLNYLVQGINDPKRQEVLSHIANSLHTLADRSAICLLEPQSQQVFYIRRRELKTTSLESLIARHRTELNKHALLMGVPKDQRDDQAVVQTLKQREAHETDIFNKIWSTFPISQEDAALIASTINDDGFPSYAKCLMVSALMLGLMVFYDERKLLLLIDIYTTNSEPAVQMRALIGALLTMNIYQQRTNHSQQLKQHLAASSEQPHFDDDMASVMFLLARSRNTENITRRIQEDIMPDIMKMRGDFMRKLRENSGQLDITDFEENPEWQKMLDDSGMSRKMEEFNEMQLDGSDVLISTFSRLKTFPFFRTLSNWFLPYHSNHSLIVTSFGESEGTLKQLVEQAPHMCNSDRYSFCLSLSSIPESQRQLLTGQLGEQTAQLAEMKNAELPDVKQERERLANEYIQDLYRFFKLFTRKREFAPAFDSDMDFNGLPLLSAQVARPQTIELIAEFYFKNNLYPDAIKYYGYLLESTKNADPHVYQKRGFSHQNLGQLEEALSDYSRFELACDNDLWTIKHMAACYRELKRYDMAMEYYQRAEQIKPGNVANTLNMGHCMLEQGQPGEALKFYFKADFLDDKKHRAWRPIAWCSFLEGNDQRSLDYYDKILHETQPTPQDFINQGHVFLCKGDIVNCAHSYKKAYELSDSNSEAFRKMIAADLPHLRKRQADIETAWLIVDAVCSDTVV